MEQHEREALVSLIEALTRGEDPPGLDLPGRSEDFVAIGQRLNVLASRLRELQEEDSERLRLTQQNYREIFDAATDMIFIQDMETGAFLDVNAETVRATGYTLEELRLHGVSRFTPDLPEYSQDRALEHIMRASQGEPQLFEWAFVDKWGTIHPTEVNLKRASIDGRACLIGITRDITERRNAEEQKRQLEHKVVTTQRLESLGVLAGGIAHDFNNILMALLGQSTLALQHVPPDSPARGHLDQVKLACVRAAELVRQMLAFAGSEPVERKPVDLSSVVREMQQLVASAVSKKAHVSMALADDLPPILGNATGLRQILLNLITNASEALRGETGSITVKTGVTALSREDLAATYADWDQVPGAYCYLEVTDSGCGIETEAVPHIFDPFFTDKSFGRGLGLTAVLGIVRSLGGAIRVETGLGQGTTFRVYVPATDDVPLPSALHPDQSADDIRVADCVLVVDDDEFVREVTSDYLETFGIEALLAANGREGLQVYTENHDRVAAIILDVCMPVLSGPETLRSLRDAGWTVPVILTSGYTAAQVEAEGMPEADDFLPKPYTPEKLMASLRRVLGESTPAD